MLNAAFQCASGFWNTSPNKHEKNSKKELTWRHLMWIDFLCSPIYEYHILYCFSKEKKVERENAQLNHIYPFALYAHEIGWFKIRISAILFMKSFACRSFFRVRWTFLSNTSSSKSVTNGGKQNEHLLKSERELKIENAHNTQPTIPYARLWDELYECEMFESVGKRMKNCVICVYI